jgi:hypothetical protein
LFLVIPRPTGWLRFNVAFSEDERLWQFLARSIEERKGERACEAALELEPAKSS